MRSVRGSCYASCMRNPKDSKRDPVVAELVAATEKVRENARDMLRAIARAERLRVWEHLGYTSHEEYLRAEVNVGPADLQELTELAALPDPRALSP